LARESGGRLTLLNVVRPATGDGAAYVCALDRLDTLHHVEADQMLARARRGLPPSVEANLMVREGLPADEILAAAAACEADLIVMGTRGRGRLAQFLLGGTAEAVIRRAACPVTVVGRPAAWAEVVDSEAQPACNRRVELEAATA
jgi:nucleotide-binding universal stress UspA family protein